MVDVRELFAVSAAQDVAEDEERAGSEEDAAPGERGVDTGFAVQHPAHVNGAAAGDAAHVVELG